MEQEGRILGDAANLESACKEDITATLRHHEGLLKSMFAGAPAAARDAIASRIEILKQEIYAKEPFHVQLVKVQDGHKGCNNRIWCRHWIQNKMTDCHK